MNRMFAWAAEQIARLLEPAEREAALGDLAESHESGVRASCHLLGLVARRQAELWKDWHPWLALIGIVAIVGLMLFKYARFVSTAAELPAWIISNYRDIDPSILEQNGMTLTLLIPKLLCFTLLLGCWSWTAGFVLAKLSGGTIWLNGSLLLLNWVFLSAWTQTGSLTAFLPLLPPVCWGIRHATRHEVLQLSRAILLAGTIVSLTVVTIWLGGIWRGGPWGMWLIQLYVLLSWPAVYLLGVSIRRPPTVRR